MLVTYQGGLILWLWQVHRGRRVTWQRSYRTGSDSGHSFIAFYWPHDPKKALIADRSPRLVIQTGDNDDAYQFVFVFSGFVIQIKRTSLSYTSREKKAVVSLY